MTEYSQGTICAANRYHEQMKHDKKGEHVDTLFCSEKVILLLLQIQFNVIFTSNPKKHVKHVS